MAEIELSIVIPARNEVNTISLCIQKAKKSLLALKLVDGLTAEIVVADNLSSDGTATVAERHGARVVRVSEGGYGNALAGGISAARGEYVVFADADDSYNFEEIGPFYDRLKQGSDFVIGNRFTGRIEKGAMPFLHRYLGTPVLTGIMNAFFGTGIGDINCGMRGLRKSAFHKMCLRTPGMEFAVEMVIKASLAGLKIAEVPCNLYVDKRGRKPHLRTWRDGWRYLRFMLLFNPAWTFMAPGLMLLAAGASGMAFIYLRDLFWPASAAFLSQKHILSSMLLFLIGFQILAFGLIARAFTFSERFNRKSRWFVWFLRLFTLEKGLATGFALFVFGAAIFAYLFMTFYGPWKSPMTEAIRFDSAVYAITACLIGVQTIFLSFVLSLFYLKVK